MTTQANTIKFPSKREKELIQERARRWAFAVGLTNPDRALSPYLRYAALNVEIPEPSLDKEKDKANNA